MKNSGLRADSHGPRGAGWRDFIIDDGIEHGVIIGFCDFHVDKVPAVLFMPQQFYRILAGTNVHDIAGLAELQAFRITIRRTDFYTRIGAIFPNPDVLDADFQEICVSFRIVETNKNSVLSAVFEFANILGPLPTVTAAIGAYNGILRIKQGRFVLV